MNMKNFQAKYYLIVAAVCLLAIVGVSVFYLFTDFSKSDKTEYLYIDDDDTADSVYAKLAPIASSHSLTGLKTLARHTKYEKHIHTGRYSINPGVSTFTILRHLRNGSQDALNLVIPESRTMDRLAAQLSNKLMLDSATLAQTLTDSALLSQYGYDTATVAALFIPNTYEVYWNITPQQFMERMVREHDTFWTTERLQKAQALGMTPNEVCTLASIIDEETSNNPEKPMIAGMYINRLKEQMPLQADPTVKFAMRRFELRRIYRDMLAFDSPWNTYRNTGLPPGPIKIASQAGIDAVLNHTVHDFLYMCAKEDFSGTHNFARTYKEHLDNAARYAKALNERGIN
jgi:UPF0755 protein